MSGIYREVACPDQGYVGLRVSQGTVLAACKEAAERLTPCVEAIFQVLQTGLTQKGLKTVWEELLQNRGSVQLEKGL